MAEVRGAHATRVPAKATSPSRTFLPDMNHPIEIVAASRRNVHASRVRSPECAISEFNCFLA